MTILRILGTAVLALFDGFSQTLRVFALPALIGTAVYAICFLLAYRGNTVLPPQAYFTLILGVLAFCTAWAAVNFHRKVLLGERFGWLPRLHVREMASYAMMCVPFLIIAWGLLLVAALLGSSFLGVAPLWQVQLAMLAATVLIGALVLLLFVQLPPIAIGRPMSGVLRKARSHWPVLLGISVVLTALQSLLPWVEHAALTPVISSGSSGGNTALSAVLTLYAIVKSLFGWAFSISLLTVLYGQISGSRPLR